MFKPKLVPTIKKHSLFLAFVLLFFSISVFKLTTNAQPFFDWDESLYVQNGLEMIKNKHFLTPLWQGKAWLDKPPLVILFFGLILQIPTVLPEISLRLFTLTTSVIALTLVYFLYLRVTNNKLIATLTAATTAFTPIFLQRSQVVSLDVSLLIGWLGFLLFYKKPFLSTLFLVLSVQSKSLLGFYPLGILFLFNFYLYFIKQINRQDLIKKLKVILFQIAFLSLWYVLMLLLFGKEFWQAHIIESHFKRVSASIESHFGQRTFYLDLLIQQLGIWLLPSIIGGLLLIWNYFKKQINTKTIFLAFAFVPWFIFLNLTKTKISWYLYPVIPQFIFLAFYPLMLFKRQTIKVLLFILILVFLLYNGIVKDQFFNTFYSSNAPHIQLSRSAKNLCSNLAVLVSPGARKTYKTLKDMHLTITTTNWWGEHPSMVYYFQKPLKFFYSKTVFNSQISRYQCIALSSEEKLKPNRIIKKMISFDSMDLYLLK